MKRKHLIGILVVAIFVTLAGCAGPIDDGGPLSNGSGDEPSDSSSTGPSGTSNESTISPNGTLSIHFINVGQGASTLIVGPTGETILIDSGDWSDDGEIVLDYLKQNDIERIDHLLSTHPDADHIGGHAAVIEYFETQGEGIGAVYDPGITSTSQTYDNYLDAIEEYNVALYETRAGDEIPIEGAKAQVLAPPEGYLADGDRNENSLVVQLDYGNSSFLLPGDGETASEQYLVDEYGANINVTVLGAGHHGSQSSSGEEFLDTTAPRIAVISSAYDSQYGHPHEDVLQRFDQRSIRTYWTATHGNIRLTSNGSAITVATQQDVPTAPLAIRDEDPIEPGSEAELQIRTIISAVGMVTEPVATDGGTTPNESTNSSSDGVLSIATIHEDAEGDDNENLNDEYIVFENVGNESLDLSGWSVSDDVGKTYEVQEGFTLEPGEQVTLHSGNGTNTGSDLYWDAGGAIWNNAGDTVIVHDDSENLVLEEAY